MPQADATTRQKQEALYGSTAVHATFGDVELAQITLRGGWNHRHAMYHLSTAHDQHKAWTSSQPEINHGQPFHTQVG